MATEVSPIVPSSLCLHSLATSVGTSVEGKISSEVQKVRMASLAKDCGNACNNVTVHGMQRMRSEGTAPSSMHQPLP